MADKKISQLTGASTPLAGTEVLPIVQSGSTVKVSIDDVTKGRTVNATTFDTDVAAAGVTLSGTTLSADGTNTNISINITPKGTGDLLTTKAHVSGTFSKNTGDENTWGVRITDLTAQAAGVGGGLVLVGNYTDGGAKAAFAAIAGAKVNGTTGNNLGDLKIYSSDVAGLLQERGSFKSTGDLAINNGNLVVGTAGKGIADSSSVARVSIASGSTVINESGADLDFRVEGVSDTDALVVDASTGRTGFGTNSPDAKVQVLSTAAIPSYKISGNSNSQGTAQKITVVRQYPVVSLGTKLIIPFFNQGVLNSTTICKVWGHGARYNTRESLGFEITFCVGNVSTTLDNLVSWGGNGNYSSIAVNGNNIEITFTTAYTSATANGIFATIEFMCNDHTLTVDVANIAMN